MSLACRHNCGAAFSSVVQDSFLLTLPDRMAANAEGVWWLRGQAMLTTITDTGPRPPDGESEKLVDSETQVFYIHEYLEVVLERARHVVDAGFGAGAKAGLDAEKDNDVAEDTA